MKENHKKEIKTEKLKKNENFFYKVKEKIQYKKNECQQRMESKDKRKQ